MFPYSKGFNPAYPNRRYESQYPGVQQAPLGFWGNDFGGNMRRPVLTSYTIVGRDTGILYLRSKTGDSNDFFTINFHTDPHYFEYHFLGKKATFVGELDWDNVAQGHYFAWSCKLEG